MVVGGGDEEGWSTTTQPLLDPSVVTHPATDNRNMAAKIATNTPLDFTLYLLERHRCKIPCHFRQIYHSCQGGITKLYLKINETSGIGNGEYGMRKSEKCISAIVQGVHSCTRLLHCCTSYYFHLPYSLFPLPALDNPLYNELIHFLGIVKVQDGNINIQRSITGNSDEIRVRVFVSPRIQVFRVF